MINGAPTDNNAKLFKEGAHSVIDGSGFKVAKEYDTPDWSPDKAQTEMEQAITALGKNGFVGVYAANDGNAGGAIAAMKSNGVDPTKIPTTGQDAELAGIQRIVAGEQYMTVYKAIKPEAEAAAQLAVDLLQGKQPDGRHDQRQTDNGSAGKVPSVLLRPGRGHRGQHQRHDHQGRVLDGRADLHRPVRGRLQVRRHPVATQPLRRGEPEMAETTPLLEMRGITKRFGAVRALNGVDFRVMPGEVVGLVGDNGAGKSTLVKVISGIHPADEGEYLWEGGPQRVTTPQDATGLGIATVYQDLALCDNLDVVENLYLGREAIAGGLLDEVTMENKANELLAELSVTTIQSVRGEVGAMSGGQRQSVAIARSLLGEPKMVILDEPTAALGVAQTAQVLALVKRLKGRGLGVIVISHNLRDVFDVCDRIFVMRLGADGGEFDVATASEQDVVAAITGLTADNGHKTEGTVTQ